jgi:hypothetical protein
VVVGELTASGAACGLCGNIAAPRAT